MNLPVLSEEQTDMYMTVKILISYLRVTEDMHWCTGRACGGIVMASDSVHAAPQGRTGTVA